MRDGLLHVVGGVPESLRVLPPVALQGFDDGKQIALARIHPIIRREQAVRFRILGEAHVEGLVADTQQP